jgi:hypothetical protein
MAQVGLNRQSDLRRSSGMIETRAALSNIDAHNWPSGLGKVPVSL